MEKPKDLQKVPIYSYTGISPFCFIVPGKWMRAHSPHSCLALHTLTQRVAVSTQLGTSLSRAVSYFPSHSSLKWNRIPKIYWGNWCKWETWLHKLEQGREHTAVTRRAAPGGSSECPGVPGPMAVPTQSSPGRNFCLPAAGGLEEHIDYMQIQQVGERGLKTPGERANCPNRSVCSAAVAGCSQNLFMLAAELSVWQKRLF